MLFKFFICFAAGIGAGLGTGFAGMSAAAVISPMLIAFLHMDPYLAVGIALASDVLASAVSAYTYGKNKNLDIRNGLVMMAFVLLFTMVGSYVSSRVPSTTMGGFSTFMTLLLGIKFILRPVMTTKESMAAVSPRKRFVQSMLSGTVIGFICGFIGAGGGMMMLLLLTSVLGYDLHRPHRRGEPFRHRRPAGPGRAGVLRAEHPALGAHCRPLCQQGPCQDPEPGHRRGAHGAGRGHSAGAVMGCRP